MPRVEIVSEQLVLVHGLTVNYDETPSRVGCDLSGNFYYDSAAYPQELWNGDKSGIIQDITIPIHIPLQSFNTPEGREAQKSIGYGCPAELVSLRNTEVADPLWDAGVFIVVALRETDEQLWHYGDGIPMCVELTMFPVSLDLGYAEMSFGCEYALVGAPVNR